MLRCFPTRVEFRIPRLKYTKGGWGRGRSMWRDAPRRAGGGLVVGFLLHPACGQQREREATVSLPRLQGAAREETGRHGNKDSGE